MPDSPPEREQPVAVDLSAVIIAVTEEVPRVLTVAHERAIDRAGQQPGVGLPLGPLDPSGHATLERALHGWVAGQTGLTLGYAEQLYTFGDRFRDPFELAGGPRIVSVAYLALTREAEPAGSARPSWHRWYEYFPWEDWRAGRPDVIPASIEPALEAWVQRAARRGEAADRRERAEIAFGLRGVSWDGERVLERYELLYQARLVSEAVRDRHLRARLLGSGLTSQTSDRDGPGLGQAMVLDHRRILATAMGRLRGKIRYRPVVFELVPDAFTLLHLQRVVEALAGVRLHKQNFRRLVDKGGLVEGTGVMEAQARGRPAELFTFRREVLRERPAAGVGLPVDRRGPS